LVQAAGIIAFRGNKRAIQRVRLFGVSLIVAQRVSIELRTRVQPKYFVSNVWSWLKEVGAEAVATVGDGV